MFTPVAQMVEHSNKKERFGFESHRVRPRDVILYGGCGSKRKTTIVLMLTRFVEYSRKIKRR